MDLEPKKKKKKEKTKTLKVGLEKTGPSSSQVVKIEKTLIILSMAHKKVKKNQSIFVPNKLESANSNPDVDIKQVFIYLTTFLDLLRYLISKANFL